LNLVNFSGNLAGRTFTDPLSKKKLLWTQSNYSAVFLATNHYLLALAVNSSADSSAEEAAAVAEAELAISSAVCWAVAEANKNNKLQAAAVD
jgi:hypothetical protein